MERGVQPSFVDRSGAVAVAVLPFESGILGRPVARLDPGAVTTPAALMRMVGEWRGRGLWLVSCRIPESAAEAARVLESCGFRQVETLLTFRLGLSEGCAQAEGVSLALAGDAEALGSIARRAFVHDRFHADPRIPGDAANRLKEAWVCNALAGRADAVLAARAAGCFLGFCACLLSGEDAVIDLIAVAPEAQGQGVGRRLVQAATAHYSGRAAGLRVGTQATNGPSLSLYSKFGMSEVARQATFHWISEQ